MINVLLEMEDRQSETISDELKEDINSLSVLGYSKSLATPPNTERQYRFFDDSLFRNVLTVEGIDVKLLKIPKRVRR